MVANWLKNRLDWLPDYIANSISRQCDADLYLLVTAAGRGTASLDTTNIYMTSSLS